MPVRETQQMIAQMAPVLQPGQFAFISLPPDAAIPPEAIGCFQEPEGTSVIVRAGPDAAQPMAQITLTVQSALDGVGLTAAVAQALAEVSIPCNVVAAYHHDHLFVPVAMADAALDRLNLLAETA